MRRLLIANRSEIACRIMRTASDLGIETVAVYSEPDRRAAHVSMADRAVALGGDSPSTSYLDIAKILDAARASEADAVHPGYGFLAENAEFAREVETAGMTFVGPTPDSIASMGDKLTARGIAAESGVPTVPSHDSGSGDLSGVAAREGADAIGYPVLVKAAAGGGGRGMRVVTDPSALDETIESARREARAAFGDDRVYLEKYLTRPRHIEIQVFGDGNGNALHLGERECSVQRRHQKVIEEAPSATLPEAARSAMIDASLALTRRLSYRGAGTVEYIFDGNDAFYFLEMNTRLQVEHAVTEMITSTDLVRWQIDVARGAGLPAEAPAARGHAIECRVYAEDPAHGFLPTSGRAHVVELPTGAGIRVDTALHDGFDVALDYDPMLAKLVVWAPDREQAIVKMIGALADFDIVGVTTNAPFLVDVLRDDAFAKGTFTTDCIAERFADWSAPADGDELAAAAAAILLTRTGNRASTSRDRDAGGMQSTPWDTLGPWRSGERR